MANWWDQYPDANAPGTEATGAAAPAEPAAPLDKYQEAAIADRARALKAGAPLPEGYTDRLARGAMFGWGDDALAAATVPFEMIKRKTWDPQEAYRYTRAAQDLRNKKIDENTAGFLGGATEVLGGLTTAGGAFGGQATAKTLPIINKTIPAPVVNYGKTVATSAGLGGIAGAGEAETAEDMLGGAAFGAGVGGTLGAAAPVVGKALGTTARVLQAPRLRDPEKIATEQIAKTIRDSGQTLKEVLQKVKDAHAAGQTEYTIADAIGHAGERKLAGVAKVPGPAREQITEALASRSLSTPQRIGGELGQAMNAPRTAAAETERLIDKASRESAPLYRQAERAGPIWNDAIADIVNDPIAKTALRRGAEIQRIEAAGTGRAAKPTESAIVDFDPAGAAITGDVPNMRSLQTLKVGLDKIIEDSINPATGRLNAYGRAVVGFKNRLLENIDAMNPVYREARRAYGGPMEVKEAVRAGQEMVTRGRAADTVPSFRALSETPQQGVRIGVVDKVMEQLEKTGNIPNYLRAKSSKGAQELEALSLYQGPQKPGRPDQLREFLNREEQMQRTSNAARGGSQTIENAADVAAQPGGVEMLGLAGNVASGRGMAAARDILGFAQRFGKGENEAQRSAMARALLTNEPSAAEKLAARLEAYERRRRGVNPWTGSYRIAP